MSTLTLPRPGDVGVERRFIDPDLCAASVADAVAMAEYSTGVYPANNLSVVRNKEGSIEKTWHRNTRDLAGFEVVHHSAQEARHVIADQMIAAAPIEWKKMVAYMRYQRGWWAQMGGLHQDDDRDYRAVLNLHETVIWSFNSETSIGARYPYGMELHPGDVGLINNLCRLDDRPEHGASNKYPDVFRIGWIFKFIPA